MKCSLLNRQVKEEKLVIEEGAFHFQHFVLLFDVFYVKNCR